MEKILVGKEQEEFFKGLRNLLVRFSNEVVLNEESFKSAFSYLEDQEDKSKIAEILWPEKVKMVVTWRAVEKPFTFHALIENMPGLDYTPAVDVAIEDPGFAWNSLVLPILELLNPMVQRCLGQPTDIKKAFDKLLNS
ncbi:MAG: hypothetical protein U1C56_01075 [Candidatus Curtissbacteria bacterium]|nr:hypothetical protein [Candidatus Curtissbacteria bacterium]